MSASRNSRTTRSTIRSSCVIGRFLLLASRSAVCGAPGAMIGASQRAGSASWMTRIRLGASPGEGAGPAVALIPNPLIIPVGVAMGILLAMPFGPINLLGIQRAVERGFFGGMAAGLGIMA